MTAVDALFSRIGATRPPSLAQWESWVDGWTAEYCDGVDVAEVSEIDLGVAVYLFDHVAERVTLAYAVSVPQLHPRNAARMRGFPDVNVGVRATLGAHAFVADRGHFLGHASGGELDINLFPHRRELNRGWSEDGKHFRRMERYVAEHPGTFFFHRPFYEDATWIPSRLEFGLVDESGQWQRALFGNRAPLAAS